jgi:hypothetical protein
MFLSMLVSRDFSPRPQAKENLKTRVKGN